jgi:hypothetical protein
VQRLDEGGVGQVGFALVAAGGQQRRSGLLLNQRLGQPGFANARFAFDDEETAVWPDLLVELAHLV